MEQTTLFDETVDRILDKERALRASNSSVFIVDEELNLISVNNKDVYDSEGKRMRPGDFLSCINAANGDGGCGMHEYCKKCKLRNAVKKALDINEVVMDECTLVQQDKGKLVIEHTVTPFDFAGKRYAIIFAVDISVRKQKQIMDRVFFHDVLNLMGALNGFVQLLLEEPDEELLREVKKLSEQVISNISYQKDVMNAENRSLTLLPTDITVRSFMDDASISLCSTAQNFNCKISITNDCGEEVPIRTDIRLLHRIILNMVKNAVEASHENGIVTVNTYLENDKSSVVFAVHNEGVIPPEYRNRIFRFGQSSKGIGRGLGTYSMKLFGESYLNGRVWFTTSEENGTTFYFALPLIAKRLRA